MDNKKIASNINRQQMLMKIFITVVFSFSFTLFLIRKKLILMDLN